MEKLIKTYEGFLSFLKKPLLKSKEELEADKDFKNLLDFLNDNGVFSMSDYNDLSDLEKTFIKTILRSKSKTHQLEVEFRLELELSNIRQLRRMLTMYEKEEDYEKCVRIKQVIDKKLKNP